MSAETQTPAIPQAKPASSLHMIATLAVVATLSGVLLVLVYQLTLPRILANKKAALEASIFEVMPDATQRATYQVTETGLEPFEGDDPLVDKVYAGYNDAGNFVGVAFEVDGQGYAGTVRILVAYDTAAQTITGYKLLESKETPGLGDKIGNDEEFLANFDALDVALSDSGDGLARPLELVKSDPEAWQIDGITGATVSSKAVTKMLNDRLPNLLPKIQAGLDQLKEATP